MSVALRAERLHRRFGDDVAVEHLDLEVAGGEIHAIVGLNGAGKTTLMRMLLGMVKPDSGEAFVLDTPVTAAGSAVWGNVGHMIEFPACWPELTVRQQLDATGRLHGLRDSRLLAVNRSIERFDLGRWADRRSRNLSMGNRQRLGLACALIHRPTVIVLDEPSNGLDPSGVVAVRELLAEEAEDGAAILVSSHHLDEIARIADRITVLHHGRSVGGLEPPGADLERTFFEMVHAADLEDRADTDA